MSANSRLYGLKGAAVKAKLARGEPILCVGLWFPYPLIGEMIARYEFDVLMLDMEHGPWDISSVTQLLIATASSPAAVMVRPGSLDKAQVQLLLDLGVDGLVVSHCDDFDIARSAVALCKYPPMGKRGTGPTRTGAYLEDMQGYLRQANDAVMLWLQIEKQIPEPELTKMLTLPGVDAIFPGPCDIANSVGHLTDWEHPEVLKIVDEIINVAKKIGMPCGIPGKVINDQLINILTSDIGSLQCGLKLALDNWTKRKLKSGHSI